MIPFTRNLPFLCVIGVIFVVGVIASAQTIQIDATPSHVRKSLIPNQALGAGN